MPKWIDGPFGQALNFDATGGYLETDYPGIGGAQARTVSFRQKVPKRCGRRNAVSMLWGSYEGKGKTAAGYGTGARMMAIWELWSRAFTMDK